MVRSRINPFKKFIREQCKEYRFPDKLGLWFKIWPEKFSCIDVDIHSPKYKCKVVFSSEWYNTVKYRELFFKKRIESAIVLFNKKELIS